MTQPIGVRSALGILARAKMNPRYAKLLATRPGYLEAVAMRDKALQKQQSLRFPQVTYPTPPDTDGADLDQYLSDYAAAYEEEQSRTRHADALTAVIGACERTINSALDNPDALLRPLSEDLDNLMGRVTEVVDRLNGATNANEAINADVADAWRELPAYRREYDDIRNTQQLLMLHDDRPPGDHTSDYVNDPLASDVVIANLDDLMPGWRGPDTRYTLQGPPPDRRPWPNDPLEQLVWLITSPAKVWIPTDSDLTALHATRRRLIDPPLEGEPGNLMTNYNNSQLNTSTRHPARIIG
jgi:hypothetical protein